MIFGMKKKINASESGRKIRMIDLHAHVLPGIDDGAPDFETSLALLKELADGGVTDVIATPHYITETIYATSREINLGLLASLRRRLKERGIDVNVYLGNEIYICKEILSLVREKTISPLADSKYLLVELPMSGEFPGYSDIFLELLRAGYRVILAHPERYASFQEDFALARELHKMGVLLQCNLGSFSSLYGKKALKTARELAKAGMIFGIGSDIHHLRGDEFMSEAFKELGKLYDADELERVLVGGGEEILRAKGA